MIKFINKVIIEFTSNSDNVIMQHRNNSSMQCSTYDAIGLSVVDDAIALRSDCFMCAILSSRRAIPFSKTR